MLLFMKRKHIILKNYLIKKIFYWSSIFTQFPGLHGMSSLFWHILSHLILCRPLLLLPPIPPSISLFQIVNSSPEVAKVLEFQL